MKYDGYRCQLAIGGGKAKVYTRSGLDWSEKFPEIAEAAASLEVGSALLDWRDRQPGRGRAGPTSRRCQAAISAGGRGLTCFLFDALEIDGEDLDPPPQCRAQGAAGQSWSARAGRPCSYAQHIVGAGEQLLQAMCDAGQEGVIAKKAEAPYRSTRSKCWLKIKCTRRQEFVVIGWIDSTSATRGLRSLILAVTEGGELRFAGKVGTGFSMDSERTLLAKLKRLERKSAPADVPRAEARGARWVRPELVAEVAFAEFTSEGVVRHASFLGLRGDKQADEVVLEEPEHAAEAPTRSSRESGKNAAGTTHSINVSNPERVIYPDANITKGELFAYHEAVGALMLEWAANRPLSLVRCPQGRGKKCFFQKHNTGSFGPSVHQIEITEGKGTVEDYVYVQDVAGLLSCVQMGTIEFHGWGIATQDVEKPDRLIFDLDPDEGLGFAEVRRAAQTCAGSSPTWGLQSFPMLTGRQGACTWCAAAPRRKWPEVKDFAQRFAIALATAEPERFTANLAKVKRKGPHLHRLSAQSARRDGDPALQRARPRRRAGGRADQLGRAGRDGGRQPVQRARRGPAAQARLVPVAAGLG
jgi:bifunctional non-homologous end joining protein LigD